MLFSQLHIENCDKANIHVKNGILLYAFILVPFITVCIDWNLYLEELFIGLLIVTSHESRQSIPLLCDIHKVKRRASGNDCHISKRIQLHTEFGNLHGSRHNLSTTFTVATLPVIPRTIRGLLFVVFASMVSVDCTTNST